MAKIPTLDSNGRAREKNLPTWLSQTAIGNIATSAANAVAAASAKYTKPTSGIPATDLAMSTVAADPTLTAAFLPRFAANTAFQAGAMILSPVGQIVKAKTGFTSTSTYSASNWDVTSGGGGTGTNSMPGYLVATEAGLIGDAATDNTAAFNAAMETLRPTGGILFFPAGIYVIRGVTTVVPGGVTLQGTGYDYSEAGALGGPNAPALNSVLIADAAMDRLVCFGSDGTSSASGQTRASAIEMIFHGNGKANTVVKTGGRRNYLTDCQAYWGIDQAVLLAGQNSHWRGGVVAQNNAGDCIRIDGYYDNKVWDAQIRQPGTTGAGIRVFNAYNTDIQRNHIWAGQNSVARAAAGLIVINGDVDKTLIQDNTIEGVLGPEVLLNTSSTIRNTLITGNRFYMNNGINTDTYPIVATQGTGSIVGLRVSNNLASGAENQRRYKSIIDFASTHSVVDRVSVADTEGGAVQSIVSGTSYPAVRIQNVRINDGASTKASEDAGVFTATGDGTTTSFTIPHGLQGAPRCVQITPGSVAAAAARYVTGGASNLTVTFTTAPANSAPVTIFWSATISGATSSAAGTVDVTAPIIASFTATPSAAQNALAWSASDNTGVTRSVVTQGGTTIYDGPAFSYTHTGLTNGTAYSYALTVYDAAGNTATASTTATPSASGGETGTVTTQLVDSFSGEAAQTAITAHTSDSGATWTRHPSYTTTVISIDDAGRVYSGSGSGGVVLASVIPSSSHQVMEADFVSLSAPSGSAAGIAVRADATADTRYHFRRILSSNTWRLDKIVAGTQTTLGASAASSLVATQVYRMKLEANGSTITGSIDGVAVVTVTDTEITNVGRFGILAVGAGGNSVGYHMDNVRGAA